MWIAAILIILYLVSALAAALVMINETVKQTEWALTDEKNHHRNFLIMILIPIANIVLMLIVLTDKER
mgnify:FL=1